MRTRREALEEIKRTATTAVVVQAAEEALKDGSDAALTRALVETREWGVTAHVVAIANEQLGFKP